MRPVLLQPLFASLTSLDGIGEKNLVRLGKVLTNHINLQHEASPTPCLPRILDLLHFLPHSVIDRRGDYTVSTLPPHKPAIIELIIDRHNPPPINRHGKPYKVTAHDSSGIIELIFFRTYGDWLQKQLPVGERRIIAGKVEYFNGLPVITHPDYILPPTERMNIPLIEPVYPLTEGLSAKLVQKAIRQALKRLPDMPEWLDAALIKQEKFPSYKEAVYRLHNPQQPADIQPESTIRRRLAYDELLAEQIALAGSRLHNQNHLGKQLPPRYNYTEKLKNALPFVLTQGQETSFSEISADMAGKYAMLRLLQGDVGSGKTAVALLAMMQAAENSTQSVLMAPTEILARQHYSTITPLAEQLGLQAALLTGREKGKNRVAILEKISKGKVQFIIGTHALFQADVAYANLALVIIDEQHRFGVAQRLQLLAKGQGVNILVMTATPIPRSLRLTAYGDMDLSSIRDKPKGRKPIKTAIISIEKIDSILAALRQAIERGDKIYWICPLVEESEKSDLTAAQERFTQLQKFFTDKVGLVHGKMPSTEKDNIMTQFKNGAIQLLVATTVVEVGVDISDASIIIIEHAERFGLAQLHQLRGRVGRSEKLSSCTLLYKEPLGKIALERLSVLRETEDGFRLAEEDLRLRGEGDILGLRQSGQPDFCFAENHKHQDLLEIAAKEARLIIPNKTIWENGNKTALQLLLYLFRQDKALHLLRSG